MGQRFSQADTARAPCGLRRFFQDNGSVIDIAAGAAIGEAQLEKTVYLLAEGWITLSHLSVGGRQSVTATYMPGDIINLDTLCEDQPQGRLQSLTRARLICVTTRQLQDAIVAEPKLAFDIFQRMIADADWLREAIGAVAQLSARDALLYFVAQTRRRQIAFGMLGADRTRFALPVSQKELANIIGISTIHVSRSLKDLREMNLFTLRSRMIDVHDLSAFDNAFAKLTRPARPAAI